MGNLVHLPTLEAKPSFENLEDLLNELSKHGEVSLRYFKDGTWYCSIDMFVIGAGISFKIMSDFRQPTSVIAAEMCHDRLLSALKDIASKVKK